MSAYQVATWLILAVWGYVLWWAFTKYDPTPTPTADELTPEDGRRDWPEHISNRVRSLLAAAPTETKGTPDE